VPIVPVEQETVVEPESDAEHVDLEPVEVIEEASNEKENVIMVEEAQVNEYVPETPAETKFQLYTEEDQWNDDLDLPPINATIERPKKPILEKTQKDKKRKRPVMMILLLAGVLLVGGTLTVAMFYNSLSEVGKKEIAAEEIVKPEALAEPQINSSEAANEEEATEQITEETVTEPATEKVSEPQVPSSEMIQTSTGQVDPSRPFHLIAGAFSVQENAERFKNKLRESGNSNAEIIGKFDGLYIVSAGSYSSNDDAMNAQKENTTISRSWIFHWP
jgi:cell division protein FtsN